VVVVDDAVSSVECRRYRVTPASVTCGARRRDKIATNSLRGSTTTRAHQHFKTSSHSQRHLRLTRRCGHIVSRMTEAS